MPWMDFLYPTGAYLRSMILPQREQQGDQEKKDQDVFDAEWGIRHGAGGMFG